jgi:tetratricopeptide (TPR) repeat protein
MADRPSADDEIERWLAQAPQLCEHTVAPPALQAFAGMDAYDAALTRACRAGRVSPRTYAALGNILVRQCRYLDALEAYRSAADADATFCQAHLACSELAHIMRDDATSALYRSAALARQRVYPDPMPQGDRVPVLLLLRDAPYSTNAPLELLLDRSRFALHKYYVEGDANEPLPEYAIAIAAFGFAHEAGAAIDRAATFLERFPRGRINDPTRYPRIAREDLEQTLSGIAGVAVVQTSLVSRDAARRLELPRLLRPVDTHAGDGFALVPNQEALDEHLERFPAGAYYATRFVDYRSGDGLFRKYRILFVDGIAYPYHLAISPRWMVHYQTSPMREHAGLREEELRFLERPQEAIRGWNDIMPAIAQRIGLEYFGIDVAQTPDGALLVFEADAAMLVHDEEADDVFAPKRPYVEIIRAALQHAITRRIPRGTP